MQIGVIFPQSEIGSDPSVIRDFAQTCEALGYSHLVVADHVLGAHPDRERTLTGPYTHETAFHEALVLLGFLAGHTTTLGLVTGVLVLPQRQTALVAKQTAEVDILSGGRLRVGVGTGWNHVEYEALNEHFGTRGRRQEEQVQLLRQLWSKPLVDYAGTWHRVDRPSIRPLPRQVIPIWFGGSAGRLMSRAARLGDGIILPMAANATRVETLDRLNRHLLAEERDRATFGIEAQVGLSGNPARWQEESRSWKQLGVDFISLRTVNAGLANPDEHLETLRQYKAEVD